MKSSKVAIQHFLREELAFRRTRNPSYSLRAYARSLRLGPSTLSQIMTGKRTISPKVAIQLLEVNSFDTAVKQQLMKVALGDKRFRANFAKRHLKVLPNEAFSQISEWYHFAILNLCDLPGTQSNPAWIAAKVGIAEKTAESAVEGLRGCGLVKVSGTKLERGVDERVTTQTNKPSVDIRRYHSGLLDKAKESLQEVDVMLRDIAAITMAIDVENIPAAKEKIRVFLNEMAILLGTGEKSQVYSLQTCLIPLSRLE